ncbi:hypothetical protein OG285_32815 [Streptomyces sp. NBC_01471]
MPALGTQGDSDELVCGPPATYDLIICHQDRIVFHDHYDSPQQRPRCLQ